MIMAGGDLGLTKNVQLKQELKESAHRMRMIDHVEFRDYVDDVEKLMKSVDVVLNFSESESFSLICLEALFYGVPLIATDCGGPAELFENEVSGLLVPNRNVQVMAAAIIKLSHDQESREAFSRSGRKFVTEKFAIEKIAPMLESLYDVDKDRVNPIFAG
jgi:glycosyltransferase involved in cell wall biosynthesis